MITAAGILFLAPGRRALFLKRSASGDHAGEWCFPGGKREGDETLEDTAKREAVEELGTLPDGTRTIWTRQIAEGETPETVVQASVQVDFTTFIQHVAAEFSPMLDGEHVGHAWAPVGQPPEPLHPGCRIALDRFALDEMGIAQAIMAGRLTSPQRFENVSLFALRITGTGVAFRRAKPKRGEAPEETRKRDEFVWRDPSVYLNPEFLLRCNGLPVIFEHPEKSILTGGEFNDRIVGMIVLPYTKGDEVWGVARIYDDAAIKLMTDDQLSTSPAVVFRDPDSTKTVELETGEKLFIEGKPSLLDHLAICERGVWDKGGEPAGVLNTGETMSDNTKTAADAQAKADADAKLKADAEAGAKLDKLLAGIDSIGSRMDAFDKRLDSFGSRMDSFEKADEDEDEKKKEEDEKKKEEDDKKKADSDVATRIAAVEKRLPIQMSDADMRARAEAQARADVVYQAFGDSAPRPLDGETLLDYRRRLAIKLKDHSPAWKPVDLGAVADSAAFDVAERQIYADAMTAATHPKDLPEGQMRPITRQDSTGRRITTFHGDPMSWMRAFTAPRRRLASIRNSNRHA